jgi:hypothetical protein
MAKFPHSKKNIRKMKKGGAVRKYAHGGSTHSCPGGYMMQNGGCVPINNGGYRRGGRTKPVRKFAHGGPHAGANQFVNRRTGQVVPAGTAYHMHPERGPMQGAVHNPNIPGGTAGHDFYDPYGNGIVMADPCVSPDPPPYCFDQRLRRRQVQSVTPRNTMRRTASSYRRGGKLGKGQFSNGIKGNRRK